MIEKPHAAIDINVLRASILSVFALPNVDAHYTLHYDETNNIRRLLLTPEGLNVRSPRSFILGGIAHPGLAPILDFEDLRVVLSLQKTALELKIGQLTKGGLFEALNAPRVEVFISWLMQQNLFVHYQVLDPLYWSIVDVVDSILTEYGEDTLILIASNLKNDLYAVLRDNVDYTAEFFGRYNYPNVGRARRKPFVGELRDFVEARHKLPHVSHQMLRGVLEIGARLDRLPYLEDESPNVLIDGFGAFYLNRIALFKNATHVLDIESTIEAYLSELGLCDGDTPARHFSFVDSKAHPWVQVSDALVGLLAKLFAFVSENPLAACQEFRSQLNPRQQRVLIMLSELLERSIDQCPGFVQYIMPLEDQRRRAAIVGV